MEAQASADTKKKEGCDTAEALSNPEVASLLSLGGANANGNITLCQELLSDRVVRVNMLFPSVLQLSFLLPFSVYLVYSFCNAVQDNGRG